MTHEQEALEKRIDELSKLNPVDRISNKSGNSVDDYILGVLLLFKYKLQREDFWTNKFGTSYAVKEIKTLIEEEKTKCNDNHGWKLHEGIGCSFCGDPFCKGNCFK